MLRNTNHTCSIVASLGEEGRGNKELPPPIRPSEGGVISN